MNDDKANIPPTTSEGWVDREKAIHIIDEWAGRILEQKFASSWFYGELYDALRSLPPAPSPAGLDGETVEACAKVAERHQRGPKEFSVALDIAKALRSLSTKGQTK